jgi:DNA-binding PadR family transcriptional regulator
MQGESALEDTQRAILNLAAQNNELRHGDFLKALMRTPNETAKGKFAKATIMKYLNQLINDGLIEVKLSSKQTNAHKIYFITPKGQLAILEDNTKCIRTNLENLERATQSLLSNPEILDEWRKTTQAVVRGITKTDGLSVGEILEGLIAGRFDEEVKQAQAERDTQFGSFRRVLKNMHQISLRLFARPPENKAEADRFFFHVNENGTIDFLSEFETIKHSDIKVQTI